MSLKVHREAISLRSNEMQKVPQKFIKSQLLSHENIDADENNNLHQRPKILTKKIETDSSS